MCLGILTYLPSVREYPDTFTLSFQCWVYFICFVLSKHSEYLTCLIQTGFRIWILIQALPPGSYFLATYEYFHYLHFGENKNYIMYVKCTVNYKNIKNRYF